MSSAQINPVILVGNIRNLYWHVRALRSWQSAKRRRLYRQIAKHKAVLLDQGFNPELLRLYCRQLASFDRAAVARFQSYLKKFDAETKKTLIA